MIIPEIRLIASKAALYNSESFFFMVFEMAASYSSRFQKRLLTLSSLVLFLILFNISGQASVMEVQRFNISQTEIDQVDYLIITSEDYENVLQSLVEWKMQRGLRSIIETVEDI
jgi:hypothetical protein